MRRRSLLILGGTAVFAVGSIAGLMLSYLFRHPVLNGDPKFADYVTRPNDMGAPYYPLMLWCGLSGGIVALALWAGARYSLRVNKRSAPARSPTIPTSPDRP